MAIAETKKSVQASRLLPAKLKPLIFQLINPDSFYRNGKVLRLTPAPRMRHISSKITGCSVGADKNGFFVYTHRARSKSYMDPLKITKKEIDYIESTG